MDKPGTAATIAKRLAQQNISLESIAQRQRGERPHGGDAQAVGQPVPVILITYATMRMQYKACRRRPRQGDFGQAAGHPHREN